MSPAPTELKRVLVVDDDVGMTTLCRRFLQQSGRFAVREENSGARAVAAAREFRPHLIYLDRRMPGLSGAEIAAELRADSELSAIPIVYITGMVECSGTLDDLPVLAKPIRGADLVRNADEMTAASA
jgi:CheY-like chemotaxis protein